MRVFFQTRGAQQKNILRSSLNIINNIIYIMKNDTNIDFCFSVLLQFWQPGLQPGTSQE